MTILGTKLGGVRVVVMGGGTGTFTVLNALKHYVEHLTAVVNMVDDGGSTGVLRDELGVLPPGDVRQALVALSLESTLMRQLMTYRFEQGALGGHSFGNLLLTALEKITGSFDDAVQTSCRILATKGDVIPVTDQDVRLCMRLPDGELLRGEYLVDSWELSLGKEAPPLFLEPAAKLHPRAAVAIQLADLIVMGPGSLWSSLLPMALIEGLPQALAETPARKVFVSNLMTQPGQTMGFLANDFLDVVEQVTGEVFDYLIYNTQRPTEEELNRYAKQGEVLVGWDKEINKQRHYRAVGADLLSDEHPDQQRGDAIPRTLVRHDSDRLARVLMRIYFS